MKTSSAAIALGIATALASVGLRAPASAEVLDYSVVTFPTEGLGTCSLQGAVRSFAGGDLEVTLSASTGEAFLSLGFLEVTESVGSGTQPGCDIFPNSPSTIMLPLPPGLKVQLSGVLDVHAHPGSDCTAGSVATGTISLSGPEADLSKLKLKCDADETHGNLRVQTFFPPIVTRGEIVTETIRIVNHGPANASGVVMTAKFPKGLFIQDFSSDKVPCKTDIKHRKLVCDVGTIPRFVAGDLFGAADIDVDLIPLKAGKANTSVAISSENAGKVFAKKDKRKTEVLQGNSAILSVKVKCKGAAGSVTINPNGSGGMTTCTCPNPNDATQEEVICIEIYPQQTLVTLTPAATTGQFDKWKDACAGNPAACQVTLDPSAQRPDKTATAKFK